MSHKVDADTQEGIANNSLERVSLETNNKNRRKGQKEKRRKGQNDPMPRVGLCGSAMSGAKRYVVKV